MAGAADAPESSGARKFSLRPLRLRNNSQSTMNAILPLFVRWDVNPTMISIGSFEIRYYGLMWALALGISAYIFSRIIKREGYPDKLFDSIFWYGVLSTIIGARLGHCLFYDPGQYLTSGKGFVEMLLPIKFLAGGGWKFTGYEGLASHGGTLGLMIALWLYCRKTKLHYMDVVDMIAVATPITACFIRLANLMNSEIIGNPTDVPWAFVFERVDMLPRHPAQLYEAIAYFIFFLGMVYLYKRGQQKREKASLPYHRGFFFGLCLTEIFVFRFFIEFLKEDQVDFERTMALNMGQWLSIPFILIGVYFMFFYGKKTAGK